MAARASHRVSIAWSGAEPFEDTDTLVLTISGYSLDLRVFTSGPDEGKIDWSTVAHVGEIEGSTKEHPKLRWDHIIDSRPPTDMPDQGTFETLADGDVAEHGTMFNPKTGDYEPYVETWRRLTQASSAPYLVLQRCQDGPEQDGQAFLGRVGNDALGLAKLAGGEYLAWRDKLVEGKWKRVYEFGQEQLVRRWLPSLPVDQSGSQEGSIVTLGNTKWTAKAAGSL
ncbi:hypothetical protein IAU60_004352 [Kwoniella sp. DSM 27419]